ncbi:hypothetical protein FHW16_003868 [Phyllobacterium myrsinacearum]|uniref:Uncharacterized protein n=1 Tax=Phyllobacterium myrsinacearum TaxID=28101 RepID=A0A839EMU2_9HYPH|nr:hypothetical protein [Phyllobacterium myrsinacearum]
MRAAGFILTGDSLAAPSNNSAEIIAFVRFGRMNPAGSRRAGSDGDATDRSGLNADAVRLFPRCICTGFPQLPKI